MILCHAALDGHRRLTKHTEAAADRKFRVVFTAEPAVGFDEHPHAVSDDFYGNVQSINQSINRKLFVTRAASCTELESEAR